MSLKKIGFLLSFLFIFIIMEIIDLMKQNHSLYFIMIIWGAGILFGLGMFMSSYIGKSESGMRQVKRGAVIGVVFLSLLTIALVNYTISYF